jgi:hypothetical protein
MHGSARDGGFGLLTLVPHVMSHSPRQCQYLARRAALLQSLYLMTSTGLVKFYLCTILTDSPLPFLL